MIFLLQSWTYSQPEVQSSRTHSEVLGLSLKTSSPRKLPVLGSRTALFFEPMKFCWKTPETSRKICEPFFCFPKLEHRRSQRGGGGGGGGQGTPPLPTEISPITRMCQKSLLFLQFQFLFNIFHLQQ